MFCVNFYTLQFKSGSKIFVKMVYRDIYNSIYYLFDLIFGSLIGGIRVSFPPGADQRSTVWENNPVDRGHLTQIPVRTLVLVL